jgi:AbrB family looped-hinge helix DNA binding protein
MRGTMSMKSMKYKAGEKCSPYSEAFFGTSTIGERGQVVIPAEARNEMGYAPGDKVLIMRHPIHKGLMLFKLEAVKEFLDEFSQDLHRLENEKLGPEKFEAEELS